MTDTASPRCPVSRSTDVVPLCDVDGYRIWRCPLSATDFVWPVPSDAELKRFYDRSAWFEGGERGGYASYDEQTAGSLSVVGDVLDAFTDGAQPRYVLDVGCGYASHLAVAAGRGWKCFGVEVSDHARQVAIDRHGDAMTIVAEIESLVPHEFDLVLILDVIEHVADPYALFFRLFNRGLIGPKTQVVITTPNARSNDAVRDPGHWQYRHPPSHLVYYSVRSLRVLLGNLLFTDVRVRGTSPIGTDEELGFTDEALAHDEALRAEAGLLCIAEGSRFVGFMQERYVPGTWSKLAEYEHLPRYQFAAQFATDRAVLDFGCGTGYGSRLLADVAASVTGLDIDEAAIAWASRWHDPARLTFDRRDDLGAGLPPATYDLVTCFEMIEHVDHATQIEAIRNIARLLKPDGQLVISTPNPAVTANYGENVYHLREMDEDQFLALLSAAFEHVTILTQWIRASVAIGSIEYEQDNNITAAALPADRQYGEPAAYVAICSHGPIEATASFIAFDSSADFVLLELRRQKAETALRLENHELRERVFDAVAVSALHFDEFEKTRRQVDEKDRGLDEQARQLATLEVNRVAQQVVFERQAIEVAGLKQAIVEAQKVVEARARESEKLQEAIAVRDRTLGLIGAEVARLQVEVEARDRSLESIGAEVARLQVEVEARDRSLESIGAEVARLQVEVEARDRSLEAQGETVRALTDYWTEKEVVVPQLQSLLAAAKRDAEVATRAAVESLAIIGELENDKLEADAARQSAVAAREALAARVVEWDALPFAEIFWRLGRRRRLSRDRHSRSPVPSAAPQVALVPPTVEPASNFAAYAVKVPQSAKADSPRVLHAIANFMTGGSSRLVVDLIERLGSDYEQHILTSFEPKPPEYLNLDVTERPMGTKREQIAEDIAAFAPDLVHVHYWGDCDEPWYREVFAAAASLGLPILQNVNTPVVPFTDVRSDHAVFVSAYVQDTFGRGLDSGEVIYPGSDFAHFERRSDLLDHRCVGMVYRLEEDKLNASAIDVFIRIAQALPDVRCLIVGGGTLLEPFRSRVRDAGCEAAFEFTGYVSYEQLPALYARMGLFVAPVWKESFGQVSSFAMNMGMPVIGYDVGAIGEIVANPSLVAPGGDANALADIAIRLLSDRGLRQAVMEANQARAATLFSVEAMVDRYRAVYERMTRPAA